VFLVFVLVLGDVLLLCKKKYNLFFFQLFDRKRGGKRGDNSGNLTVKDRKKNELHKKEVYNSYKSIKISESR